MINQINFWASWPTPYKRLLVVLSTVSVLSLIALWLSFYQSPAPVIPTEQYQQIETHEIALHSFSFAGITLTTTGDNFLLFEYQRGGYFTTNKVAAYYIKSFLVFCWHGLVYFVYCWLSAGDHLFVWPYQQITCFGNYWFIG
jgi:hypothetical protein